MTPAKADPHVCAECGQVDFFHCPKGTPDQFGVSIWCASDGPKQANGGRKRVDIPLSEWQATHGRIAQPALAVERIKSAEPGIQLDMMSTWELTPTGAGDGRPGY
jgi:hypothetical protein